MVCEWWTVEHGEQPMIWIPSIVAFLWLAWSLASKSNTVIETSDDLTIAVAPLTVFALTVGVSLVVWLASGPGK